MQVMYQDRAQLYQEREDGKQKTKEFASRTLLVAEKNYMTEKELLSIVFATKNSGPIY